MAIPVKSLLEKHLRIDISSYALFIGFLFSELRPIRIPVADGPPKDPRSLVCTSKPLCDRLTDAVDTVVDVPA